ncbi:MAG: RNA-binding cell elongation regulator Jag/EloR [Candidatus Ozemobacteraceae bacterium]
MQRVIEISAKSHEEAREIAKRELKPGECIAGEETLAAPARGIFGVVGNPEVKMRFTFEPSPVSAQASSVASAQPLFNLDEEVIAPTPAPSAAPIGRPYETDSQPRRPEGGNRGPRPAARGGYDRPGPSDRPQRTDRPSGPGRPARDNNRPPRREEPAPEMGSFSEDDDEDTLPGDMSLEGMEGGSGRSPRDVSTGPIGTAHPLHALLHQIFRETAESVGITDMTVEEHTEDSHWVIDARSENISQLIGKHGRTLDALQYLLNIIANKGREGRVKILLDAQGYRDQRHKGLIMLANRMYRKVLDAGRQVELEPMSTIDRRTVHLALKDKAGVETFSRGIEPMRRVIISPRRGAGRREGPARGERDAAPPRKPLAAGPRPATPPGRAVPVFMQEDDTED